MRTRRNLWVVLLLAGVLGACGSDEGGRLPSPSPTPTPTPIGPTHAVDLFVYYDENNNGQLDSSEIVRVAGVDVHLGSQVGRSVVRTGGVHLNAVPAGRYTVAIDHLPPYYQAGAMPTMDVPSSAAVAVPVRLPIGSNHPNVYLAFGDSITSGQGSTDGTGYQTNLVARLRSRMQKARIIDDGYPGTRSSKGSDRILASLASEQPAYVLILYGTNDWNDTACKTNTNCPTVDNLLSIVNKTLSQSALPVLGTIIPSNPTVSTQNPDPVARNNWIAGVNDQLRLKAYTQGFLLADLHKAFMAEPSLAALFKDHIHPNDAGYLILSREFFRAITGDPSVAADFGASVASEPPDLLPLEAPMAEAVPDATQN